MRIALDAFFIVSFLLFGSGMLLVYKTPEKKSLFRSIVICYITELCFGALITGIYLLLQVPIDIGSLGIAYLILGVLTWGVIIKQKKMQKLTIMREDIYAFIVIVVWFGIIFLKIFSPSISLAYMNGDSAEHYLKALNVMDSKKVTVMYFAEVYNSVFLELLSPFLVRLSLYKAFILADSMAHLLNVFMFYILLTTFIKQKFTKAVAPFICFLYFAGWPFFNYVVGGFVYFGWGVTLFAYIVYLLIKLYESSIKRNQFILLGLIIVGCISELVCYVFFSPILGGVVLLCLAYIAKKNKITCSIRLKIIICSFILLIGIVAFLVFFLGYFDGSFEYILLCLKIDGGMHKVLVSDFVFLIPSAIYMGSIYIRNKEVNFIFLTISVIIAYIVVTFAMCYFEVLSSYYFYKSYYLLWFFSWVICTAAIEYFWEKDRKIIFAYGGTVIITIILSLSGADNKLVQKGIIRDEISTFIYPSSFPLYDRMERMFIESQLLEDKSALFDACNSIDMLVPKEESCFLISDVWWMTKWYTALTGKDDIYITSDEEFSEALNTCLEKQSKYVSIYQNTDLYRDNKFLLSDYELIYDNGYFGLYKIGELE